jgi:hypothetical protein
MNLNRIKEYLSNYLNSVLLPKVSSDMTISMEVIDVLKGSYQPPIYHVFINIEPHDTLKSTLKQTESDIANFFKIFSINNKIKVHWNKRPSFKDKEKLDLI